MSENKNNLQNIIKELQDCKTQRFAPLTSDISREKSRAIAFRDAIRAKLEELSAKAEKSVAETPQDIPVEPIAQTDDATIEPVEQVVVHEEQPAQVVEDIKVNENQPKPVVEEVKVEEVKPEVISKDSKIVNNEKKTEEKKETEKKAKPAKTQTVAPSATAPTEVSRKETGKPNVWLITFSDGSQRETYVPPVKEKKTVTKVRVFTPEEQTNRGRSQGANGYQRPQGQFAGRSQQPGGRPQQLGASNTAIANAAQQFPAKANQNRGKGQNQKPNDNSKKFSENGASKYQLLKKGYIIDESRALTDDEELRVRSFKGSKQKGQSTSNAIIIDHAVITTDPVSIKTLSEKIGKTGAEIIRTLFMLGIIKNINGSIDFETAELVTSELCKDHPITLEYRPETTYEDELTEIRKQQDEQDQDKLVSRPPVVCIMGHVDHGKTSLLDYIRHSNVTSGEAGGITQHIGAYTISLKGNPITFLDTPGHEAFTTMRARGAMATDIAILVVAADDGIMPQTIEAISHARLAGVPIIVACNKIDKPSANPDKVLQQLTEHSLLPEIWGGDTPVVNVSAKTGQGVDELLENILTLAEIKELRANPNRTARGTIIEARMDKGLGKIATVLVQSGTLKCGDDIVAGTCSGRVKVMIDDKGRQVKKAGPSIPVSVTGWDDLPEAGDTMDVVASDHFARNLAEERKLKAAHSEETTDSVNLEDLFSKISEGELKSVNLIIKADVQGSLEAVKQSLGKLGNDEVRIEIKHGGVGAINESDVSLAVAAHAVIIGFNVRPDANAKSLAAQKKIDIRYYNVIYKAIEDIEAAVKGMLAPKFREVVLGSAEIRELFKISGVGTIAGSHVVEGKIIRGAKARLIRNGKVEVDSEIESLRHGKDDVKEILKNFDCGIMLHNYPDVKVGDVIEAYQMEQI